MDYNAHETKAKSKTGQMLVLFLVAVIGTACVLFLPVVLACINNEVMWRRVVTPQTFIICFDISAAIICLAAYWKWTQLKEGGKAVARESGATPLDTNDAQHSKFIEVVLEIAEAAQTPVPALYVLNDEARMNAFVAGRHHSDCVMAITRGALDGLTREELSGVVAHEFSHIKNGDMKLGTDLIAVVFGVSFLARLGRKLLGWTDIGRFVGVALICSGLVGLLCSRAIQAGISRQRELLADASAARLTNNPSGLASALNKIEMAQANAASPLSMLSHLNHLMLYDCRGPNGKELDFVSKFELMLERVLRSHPPIADRIKALDPNFPRSL